MDTNTPRGKSLPLFMLILGLALLSTALGLVVLEGREKRSESSSSLGASSSIIAEKVTNFCREHQDIIDQMPEHPKSQEIVQGIVTMWRDVTGLTENEAQRGVIIALKDSPVGLAALDAYLQAGHQDDICSVLVTEYPDSRAACMALDRQIGKTPGQAERLLDQAIAEAPDSRLAVFALTRKGNLAREAGDMRQAAQYWLEAWLKEPQRGKALFGNLCLFWLQAGDWDYPLLMTGEYMEDPVLNPVKERALAALNKPEPQPGTPRALVREVGGVLESGDIKSAVSLFDQLIASTGSMSPEDRACLGTAAFLLGSDKDFILTVDTRQSVELRGELARCRERMLDWGWEAYSSLPPDVAVMFTMLVTERQLQDARVKQALQTLEKTYRVIVASPQGREQLVERLADVLVQEEGDSRGAGQVLADYCDNAEKPRPDLQLRAASLLQTAGEYDRSLQQLEKLSDALLGEDLKAAAAFLRILDYKGKGDESKAADLLEAFPETYPRSQFAPQALDLMARTAIVEGDYAGAAACFQDLVDKYPQSKYAGMARQELTQLQEEADKGEH